MPINNLSSLLNTGYESVAKRDVIDQAAIQSPEAW